MHTNIFLFVQELEDSSVNYFDVSVEVLGLLGFSSGISPVLMELNFFLFFSQRSQLLLDLFESLLSVNPPFNMRNCYYS